VRTQSSARRPLALVPAVRPAAASLVRRPAQQRQLLAVGRVQRPARTATWVQACAAGAVTPPGPDDTPFDKGASKLFGPNMGPQVVTLLFIAVWYGLNIAFNLRNKTIFNYFPFPWTVSAIHVVVGAAYCGITYLLGFKEASFGRPISKQEFKQIFWPASMHAIGHIAANLSFAAVAISLTHTVKTLEPAFNVVLSRALLGTVTPTPVIATLVPIMVGVAMASAAELSFNWMGFISAMVSNLTFGFRAVLSKKAMGDIKNLNSTAVYAWTTLISVFICVPAALIMEGPRLRLAVDALANSHPNFYMDLFIVGLLYHLYNQFAFNTLSRVTPVAHGVCNVVKRVCIIGTSVVFFGNAMTNQTKLGTVIALIGTYLYTQASQRYKGASAKTATA
jgi:Tpt phosphate/phosphoenolpyruvate translocator